MLYINHDSDVPKPYYAAIMSFLMGECSQVEAELAIRVNSIRFYNQPLTYTIARKYFVMYVRKLCPLVDHIMKIKEPM